MDAYYDEYFNTKEKTVTTLEDEIHETLNAASFFNKDAKEKLKNYIEEIERQEDAKQDIVETIKSFYEEAKAEGFDTKAMRQVLRLRKKGKQEWDEEMSILDVYVHALGME